MIFRTYAELSQLRTFEERYDYLQLRGAVGMETFGFDRYINQKFYGSTEWRRVRHHVIARDNGCDLGIEGHDIYDRIYIHHMNPMSADDIKHGSSDILNPEYLISVTHNTHNAIHYGDRSLLQIAFVERTPGDTKPW